jgi:phosphopantetheine--protein transferase-like protein
MQTLSEFIDNLTGREGLSLSQLSSAQKARVIAWARDADVHIDEGLTPSVRNEHIFDDRPNHFETTSTKIKTGIDIQSIKEFFPEVIDDLKSDRSLLNIFTMSEMSYAESKEEPLTHLTGMFALKEAIMKASNTMLKDLSEIEIMHNTSGAPKFDGFSLSLSYSGDLVAAMAVSVAKKGHGTEDIEEIKIRLLKLESFLKLEPEEAWVFPLILKVGFFTTLIAFGYYLNNFVRLYFNFT